MKKLFVILCCALLCVNLYALPLDSIESEMKARIDKSMKIVKTNKDSKIMADEIFALFDFMFDYELMAKLSLSKEYNNLDNRQKEMFVSYYKKSLQQNFASKLELYKDNIIEVVGGEQIKENRYNLIASIVIDGALSYIIFKFYPKNNDWLIYDVDIIGISVVQTYRSQFADILKSSGIDGVFDRLKSGELFAEE